MTDAVADETRIVRGPYRNGVRRRREIIESASKVFASYGFVSGSLRQIASEVGVTPAALSRHFDNKEGLLSAVMEHWDEDAAARNPSDVTGLDYFVRLRDAVIHNQANRGLIELFLTLGAESSNPAHPARKSMQQRYRAVCQTGVDHLKEARERGDILWMDDDTIEAEARSVFAMMDGLQLQWLIDPAIDLIHVFTIALEGYLVRWTGLNHVLGTLTTPKDQ